MRVKVIPYRLRFKFPAGTSRGVLREKQTYFLVAEDGTYTAVGECALFRGLSYDDRPDYEDFLRRFARRLEEGDFPLPSDLREWPSIRFGYETLLRSLASPRADMLFSSEFTAGKKGIPINGLIWMGDKDFMLRQVEDKLAKGFRVIKMKIGALDFEKELDVIAHIRRHFSADEVEIRTDANGAFSPDEALEKLSRLAEWEVHSVEQPLKAGQTEETARLCELSPVPVALDEELLAVQSPHEKKELLKIIRPAYIVIKPSLTGGFEGTAEWMEAARASNTGYWITSALESNVGLNAIAQYTASLHPQMPQGLGTGQLYRNNIPSPLYLEGDRLFFDPSRKMEFKFFA